MEIQATLGATTTVSHRSRSLAANRTADRLGYPGRVSDYVVKALGPDTWDAFARLAERHNGVCGGCWCTWFHTMHSEKTFNAEDNRALKQRLVNEGRAHAALVFDGDEAVA